MKLHCLGVSHKQSCVELRERLTFSPSKVATSLERLGCGDQGALDPIQEMVILSTCNRVEIYATAPRPSFVMLEDFLCETSAVAREEFSAEVYRLLDGAAIVHLMQVAAGLDSLVLGEPQILGQVTDALALARSQGTAGKILSRLFQSAIHAGKRARTETAISHNPSSIASVAVGMILKTIPDVTSCQVTVVGAGDMAALSVKALKKRKIGDITVVNRTLERAENLAQNWGGRAATFEMLPDLLVKTDVLITSTGAPHIIIHPWMVEAAFVQRNGNPLVIMDIAVPRDVNPSVGLLPGVSLFDIDQMSNGVEDSLAKRRDEIPMVEEIIQTEVAEFMDYLCTLDVVPIIVQMRRQAHQIRKSELEKTIRSMPDLSADEQERINALTKAIVNKILHAPTARLRDEANGPGAIDYANVTRNLFKLD